jgi:hypothetical protein
MIDECCHAKPPLKALQPSAVGIRPAIFLRYQLNNRVMVLILVFGPICLEEQRLLLRKEEMHARAVADVKPNRKDS